MPLEVIETTAATAEIMRFQASPIYEMIVSLQVLLMPGRHEDWAASVRGELSPDFLDELSIVYGPFKNGAVFFELPIDYDDHEDVLGFIAHVRRMDPIRFLFYLFGRILTPEEIEATGPEFSAIIDAIMDTSYGAHCGCNDPAFDDMILRDVPAFQNRLADLWETYWHAFFKAHEADFRPRWEAAIEEKRTLLNRIGGQELYLHIVNRDKPLPTLPPGHPVTDVVFIPLYLLPGPVYMIYGYGNVTVLFDSERTEARIAEMQERKEQLLAVFKALGDSSRLDILRTVSQYEGVINGKKIAEHLNLSAPTVSRHLTQLRDAGLIVEESQDNRTITYRLQRDVIQELPNRLLDYLRH